MEKSKQASDTQKTALVKALDTLRSYENTELMVKLKSGEIVEPSVEIDPKEVERFIGKDEIKKIVLTDIFGKDIGFKSQYETVLTLLKVIKENTTSQQESSVHKKQKLWVYNRPIKKNTKSKKKKDINK